MSEEQKYNIIMVLIGIAISISLSLISLLIMKIISIYMTFYGYNFDDIGICYWILAVAFGIVSGGPDYLASPDSKGKYHFIFHIFELMSYGLFLIGFLYFYPGLIF